MNLIFSYSVADDEQLETEGHIFLGAGKDRNGSEVHVFLDKDKSLQEHSCEVTHNTLS